MSRMSQLTPVELDNKGTELRTRKDGQSATFTFGGNDGNIISLIRFKNTGAGKVALPDFQLPEGSMFFDNLVYASDGYYLKSEEDGFIVKAGNDGKVQEMARFFRH